MVVPMFVMPRWRNWAMQASLWVVLGGTLLLAQWVIDWRLRATHIGLEAPQAVGDIVLAKPVGWTLNQTPEGAIILDEPTKNGVSPRRIEIRAGRVRGFVSPLEYLVHGGYLRLRDAAEFVAQDSQARIIQVAGWPGVLVSRSMLQRIGARRAVPWKQVLACAVVPGGGALVLRLEVEGSLDASDEDLLRRVAQSVSVGAFPRGVAATELELPDDLRIGLPGGLLGADKPDTLRVGRVLIANGDNGWTGVELAPCLVLPGQDADDVLMSAVMLRGGTFPPAVRRIDYRTWVCGQAPEGLFPSLTYLRVNEDGRGLLAQFRWCSFPASPDAATRAEGMWDSIVRHSTFEKELDIQGMLGDSMQAVRQLSADRRRLLDGSSIDQTWQWYHDQESSQAWTDIQWRLRPGGLYGAQLTIRTAPLGSGEREEAEWLLGADGSGYQYKMTRRGAGFPLVHEVRLAEGWLQDAVRQGKVVAVWRQLAPENYIPGAVLPLEMGQLPFEPMVLRTESVPSAAGWVSALPLTLVLEPWFDEPRYLPGEVEPMRCWTVRVNGTSESTRWYLDKQGRLRSISFAGGIHVQRVDASGGVPATQEGPGDETIRVREGP